MKKKIISLMLIGTLMMSLSGCVKDVVNRDGVSGGESKRFVKTGDCYTTASYSFNVYYDSKTKIVYLVSDNVNSSGISAMYNKDGKPMTLDEYNATK